MVILRIKYNRAARFASKLCGSHEAGARRAAKHIASRPSLKRQRTDFNVHITSPSERSFEGGTDASRQGERCTSTARHSFDISRGQIRGVYPFAAGRPRPGASGQSRGTPRHFDAGKISNPNFPYIHLARGRQNNRTTSRPHFSLKHTKHHRISIKLPSITQKLALSRRWATSAATFSSKRIDKPVCCVSSDKVDSQ